MTIEEAIKKADILRPNAIPKEIKAEWVNSFNQQVAEFFGGNAERIELKEDGDMYEDVELAIPAPYDDVYVYNLMAQIDNGQEETSLYANDMEVANSALSDARRWWKRESRPVCHNYIRGLI